MNRISSATATALAILSSVACADWPQFRGPAGDGIAIEQSVPTEFGEQKNVTWKTEIPGKAWSSPVVADGVIWVTTAIERLPTEEEKIALFKQADIEEKKFKQLAIAKSIELKLLAIDFASGSILKTIDLTVVEQPDAIHAVNSYASPTPVIDGDNIYCHFGTYGTFCINRATGAEVWKRRLPLAHSVGPGSSPFIYQDMLVLIQDGLERQYVTALNKFTGVRVWETDRPEMDAPDGDQKKAFCTPIAITDSKGRDQLICMSSQWIVAYEPATGNEIWKLYHGKGFSVVPRPVYADDVVYFSTGFGKPQLWAARVDGEGDVTETHVLWKVTKGIPAKSSPLLHDGLVYVMEDNGIASCFDAKTGEEVWKKRIGGKYSASPLLAGGHIYFGSHDGKVVVLKPGKSGEVVADNQLEGQIMASPAAVDNALIMRTAAAVYRIEAK
jgi:outer membrane protein assembly factor BamB